MVRTLIVAAATTLHELQPDERASLSQAELDRATRLKAERRRREFLCGRALLRALLQRHTGRSAGSHQLETDDRGKPFCIDGPAVSIAHSGNLVLCALASGSDIGVDVEIPDHERNIEGIAERFFAEDEAAWLATQPGDRFYMLWVLKEAWLKAEGHGIPGGLDRLRCFVAPPTIDVRLAGGAAPVLSLFALDDALVGLATPAGGHDTVVIERWDPFACRFDANSGARLIATTA